METKKMLKDMGNKKKKKMIKCDNSKCKHRFELDEEDIIRIGSYKYCECPACGNNIVLK